MHRRMCGQIAGRTDDGHPHRRPEGTAPTTAMTHIAIQEALNGKAVEWLEKVTDEEYLIGPPA